MEKDIKLTIFSAKQSKSKVPYSPFDDSTFIFETISEITSNIMFYNTLVSHWVLNIPLGKITKPIKTQKVLKDLEIFYSSEFNYFIVDIECTSEFNKEKIISYFKDYKCTLGESRSYNGYTNFNIKGVIFTVPLSYPELRVAFADIQRDIEEFGYLNDNSIKRVAHSAPVLKNKVFFNNETGVLLQKVNRSISSYIKDVETNISTETVNSISELCLSVFKSLGFEIQRENSNGSISFQKDSDKYFWYQNSPFVMHNNNRLKSINIFNSIKNNPEYRRLTSKINFDAVLSEKQGEYWNFTEKLFSITGKEELIDKFLHNRNGLLSIKSPMGTGKGILIKYIIEQSHNSDMKVLIITNRISVAVDFARKYSDMKLYNRDSYEIGDSLIVQYDSLWKYNISFFDLIIMDEFSSLCLHSRDNVSNNAVNLLKFIGCFNKKLIIADAFLTGYEYKIINKSTNIVNIVNDFRDPVKLTEFKSKNRFFSVIKEHAIEAKKSQRTISVSSTSTSVIYGLKLMLEKYNLRVITLTSDTHELAKEEIYKEFQKIETSKWDVIIFSPTLTVGVSNLNDVEDHFHYDSASSADVISSIQMIKRSRRARNIHYYIADKTNYLCTDYNTLRENYLGNTLDSKNNYLFDTDDYGELRLSKIGRTALHIDVMSNILNLNRKNSFKYLLNYHFSGDVIYNIEDNPPVIEEFQKLYQEDSKFSVNNALKELKELTGSGSYSNSELDIDLQNFLLAQGLTDSQIEKITEKVPQRLQKKMKENLISYSLLYREFTEIFSISKDYNNKMHQLAKNIYDSRDLLVHIGKRISQKDMKEMSYIYFL